MNQAEMVFESEVSGDDDSELGLSASNISRLFNKTILEVNVVSGDSSKFFISGSIRQVKAKLDGLTDAEKQCIKLKIKHPSGKIFFFPR